MAVAIRRTISWLSSLFYLFSIIPYCCSFSTTTPIYQDPNYQKYQTMLQVSSVAKETFEDKCVLLTGATGGLGTQLALQLVQCHVRSLILSGRNLEALQSVKDMCTDLVDDDKTDIDIQLIPCDLSDRDSVLNLGRKAVGGNKIDVLINCGGVSSRSNFVDTKLEIDETIMQINFFAGVALAKAVVPAMVSSGGGGKIIWISSVQGLVGIPSRTSYAASKFAVQGYCEALRAELAPNGITVHCVSPGYIRTNLSKSALTGDGTAHGQMDSTTENGADPKEVAVTILDKVAKGSNDFIVAATISAKAAIWMKLLCPAILQKLLVKRFQKSELSKEKKD
jgi:dehydrogenase/reductase SDR family protein 7B